MVVYENLFSSSVKKITAIMNYLRTSQKSLSFMQGTKSRAGKIYKLGFYCIVFCCRVEAQQTRIDQKKYQILAQQLVREAEKKRCKETHCMHNND